MGVDSDLNAIGIRNNGANPMIRPQGFFGNKKVWFQPSTKCGYWDMK